MARLGTCGFETGDGSELKLNRIGAISSLNSGKGAYSWKIATSASPNDNQVFTGLNASRLRAKAWIMVDSTATPSAYTNSQLMFWNSAGTTRCGGVLIEQSPTDGSWLLWIINSANTGVASGSISITANQWYCLEVDFTIGSATGAATAYLDGAQIVTTSSQNFSANNIGLVAYGYQVGGVQGTKAFYWDDIEIDDAALCGKTYVIARQIKAGTPTYDAWTKSGGTTIDTVWDETPFNASTNANTGSTKNALAQTGLVASFSATQTGHGSGVIVDTLDLIKAIKVGVVGKISNATASSFAIRRRFASADTDTSIALTASDAYYETPIFTDTLANLNASEIGANKLSTSNARTVTVEDVWIFVSYLPLEARLTANNLDDSSPSFGTPSIGQVHALTATALAPSSPAFGAPALGQVHALTATALAVSSPDLGSPVLAIVTPLTANSLSVGSPSFGSPSVGQAHALTANTLDVGSPALATPLLGQVHALTATALASSSPSFGTPALGVISNLTANSLSVGSPGFDTPSVGQVHVLAANALDVSSPSFGTPVLVAGALVAINLDVGSPSFGTPTLAQIQPFTAANLTVGSPYVTAVPAFDVVESLTANALSVGSPAFDTPSLAQVHALTASILDVGSPALGTPTLTQKQALTANNLDIGSPTFGTPVLGVISNFTANTLDVGSPAFGTPTIGQVHALTATDLTIGSPGFDTPVLVRVVNLVANNLDTGSPTFATPTLAQVHALTASTFDVGSPTLATPALAQAHVLTATNLDIGSPAFGTPSLAGTHVLTANDLTIGSPSLATPTLAQIHALTANALSPSSPTFGTPTLVDVVGLTANDLTIGSPVLGTPTLQVVVDLMLGDHVLDGGLTALADADAIILSSVQSLDYATVDAAKLGQQSFGTGNVFGAPAAGAPSGRKATSVAVTNGLISAVGLPAAWVIADTVNSRVLASGKMAGGIATRMDKRWTLDAITIHLPVN